MDSVMNVSGFWAILQRAHDASAGDMHKKCGAIRGEIAKLSRDDALEFSRLFDSMMDKAYSWPLWGAAYLINGGCGDDTFIDFRASLLSRGHDEFESALADPDSLAEKDFDEDVWFYEGYDYAVAAAVNAVAASVPIRELPYPETPSGEEWTEKEVYDLYPRLREKYA